MRFLHRITCISISALALSYALIRMKNKPLTMPMPEEVINVAADVPIELPLLVADLEVDFTEAKSWAQYIMREMRVPRHEYIRIGQTNGVSHATSRAMNINTAAPFGPWQFVVAHEAAHIALGHPLTSGPLDTDEVTRTQEVQADLYAYECLYRLGRKDLIFQRLAHIMTAINDKWHEPDLNDHPSLRFMASYTKGFLEEKGEQVTDLSSYLMRQHASQKTTLLA